MDYRENVPDNTYKAFFRRYSCPGQPARSGLARGLSAFLHSEWCAVLVCHAPPPLRRLRHARQYVAECADRVSDPHGTAADGLPQHRFGGERAQQLHPLGHELLDGVVDFGVVETEAD